jgi:hypothetical protein
MNDDPDEFEGGMCGCFLVICMFVGFETILEWFFHALVG